MEDRTIIAKGKPTIKNIVQFFVYSQGVRLLIFIMSIYLLVTLYYTTTMYGDQRAILVVSLQKAILPAILLFLLYLLVLSIREQRLVKKKDIQHNDVVLFTINRKGIQQQRGSVQEQIGWSTVLKVKEYKELFLFRHSFQKWNYLPKHYFQSEEDLAFFKQILQERRAHSPVENNTQPTLNLAESDFVSTDSQESAIVTKGNYTFQEYNHYTFLYRRKMTTSYLLFVTIACGWLIRDFLSVSPARWDQSVWELVVWILFMIVVGTAVLYLLLKRRSRKEYNSDSLSKKEKLFIINEKGLTYVLGDTSAKYQWNDFRQVREHKNMFFFYLIPQRAVLLPFRLFESPQEVEKVKKLIIKNMDSKNVKFK